MHLTKITISIFVMNPYTKISKHINTVLLLAWLCCYVNPCEGQASLGVTGGALSCCVHTLCNPAASLLAAFCEHEPECEFPLAIAQMGKWALPLACGVWHLRNCAVLYTVLHVHRDLANKQLTMST